MSRSGYSDDCEGINLWRGTVERSLKGKRGQAFLIELAAAMDAMLHKRLIKAELIDAEGECCTIGVVCKTRAIDVAQVDVTCRETVGSLVGISPAMAAEIEYMNDEDGPWKETSEERWLRMRAWVAEQIKKEAEQAKDQRGVMKEKTMKDELASSVRDAVEAYLANYGPRVVLSIDNSTELHAIILQAIEEHDAPSSPAPEKD